MAARAGKMERDSDGSSSSDEEELRRCRDAVWETPSDKKKGEGENSNVKQSKRVVVDDHAHDGNELQVTQGFRTHVAKKLGLLLDSYFTETPTKTLSCVESANGDDDEGFCLFSTSVPGQTAEDAPAPVRRRPVPSSSDSDSEMETRLREAAVSVKDLLPSFRPVQPSTLSPASTQNRKKKKKAAKGEESDAKEKKRRKQNREEGAAVDSAGSPFNARSNGERGSSEQEHTQVKVKRKKNKKRKEITEALN